MVESGLHGLSQHHLGRRFWAVASCPPTFAGFQVQIPKTKQKNPPVGSWKLGNVSFFFIKSGSFLLFFIAPIAFWPTKYSWKITGWWPMGRKCKWATPCASGAKRRWHWCKGFGFWGGEWNTRWRLKQPLWEVCSSNWESFPEGSGWKNIKTFELPPPKKTLGWHEPRNLEGVIFRNLFGFKITPPYWIG